MPDELAGEQVHVVYAVPRDGRDAGLDTTGAIERSLTSVQAWLRGQTSGRGLRLDKYGSRLDITFVRLEQDEKAFTRRDAYVRDALEEELQRRGLLVPHKLYAVYYDGGSNYACGGGAYPPFLRGRVAALYLRGAPPNGPPCSSVIFGAGASTPGYWEFSMLHELLHTMGFVSLASPNQVQRGHVDTDPRDLMYAGSLPWLPDSLDVNRHNYYSEQRLPANIANFAESAFLDPVILRVPH